MRVQRAHVDVIGGIRTGIVLVVLMSASYRLGLLSEGLSLGIGALFASISDSADSTGRRLRAMAWGTTWSAVGTLAGGLVSDFEPIHIVMGFAVAFACGYASALGARGALIGTLTLVLFAVFGGDVIGTGIAFLDFALVIVGGAAYAVVAVAASPFKRIPAARLAVARAYRAYAEATHRTGLELTAPTVAVEAMAARTVTDHLGVRGATADWLHGLISDLERTRLALLALLALEGEDDGYAVRLVHASGLVARRIGDTLVGPVARDVAGPLADLESIRGVACGEVLRSLMDRRLVKIVGRADEVGRPMLYGTTNEFLKQFGIGKLEELPNSKELNR